MCATRRGSNSANVNLAVSSETREPEWGQDGATRVDEPGLRPRMKVWVCAGDQEGVFGDGKWRLLKAIHETQSLAAAAESLHMSYRKAWGDIRKAERTLGVALVERHRGGAAGGSTQLTPTGQRWVRSYSQFRQRVAADLQQAFAECMLDMEHDDGE